MNEEERIQLECLYCHIADELNKLNLDLFLTYSLSSENIKSIKCLKSMLINLETDFIMHSTSELTKIAERIESDINYESLSKEIFDNVMNKLFIKIIETESEKKILEKKLGINI